MKTRVKLKLKGVTGTPSKLGAANWFETCGCNCDFIYPPKSSCHSQFKGRLTGGVQTEGLQDLDLIFLLCPVWNFPDFVGDFPNFQSTPWGGVEKGGGRKTSRMTPLPKRLFWPPSFGTFSTPLWCRSSFFLVESRGLTKPDAHLEGPRDFLEGALFGTFH